VKFGADPTRATSTRARRCPRVLRSSRTGAPASSSRDTTANWATRPERPRADPLGGTRSRRSSDLHRQFGRSSTPAARGAGTGVVQEAPVHDVIRRREAHGSPMIERDDFFEALKGGTPVASTSSCTASCRATTGQVSRLERAGGPALHTCSSGRQLRPTSPGGQVRHDADHRRLAG